jgi:hypothetical protein
MKKRGGFVGDVLLAAAAAGAAIYGRKMLTRKRGGRKLPKRKTKSELV